MLRSSAARSHNEYETAGELQLAANEFRTRDDFDPGSFAASLAAHWGSHVPQHAKDSYGESVVYYAARRPRSRRPEPNYSVGTRGLPFINQLPSDGVHRGNGMY